MPRHVNGAGSTYVIIIKVRGKPLTFQIRLPPNGTVGDLKRECIRQLKRPQNRRLFIIKTIGVSCFTDLQLKSQGRILNDDSKPLMRSCVRSGGTVEVDVKCLQYGVNSMLHFLCKVNDVDAIGFVDCGCAISTISSNLAETLGLKKEIDRRFTYRVDGPSGDRVLGSLHHVKLQIGDAVFYTNFDVMESEDDVWLGLDLMYREGICVDVLAMTMAIRSCNAQVKMMTQRAAADGLNALKREQNDQDSGTSDHSECE
ncbi:uncharacterized protein LOC143036659 [Oratosquilla oratoria]|uniref:uncharacterized protein LOC143036659 n=1 Tax=Oratosquilla oratoria TaxID=337810 RepID=UPI003F776A7D